MRSWKPRARVIWSALAVAILAAIAAAGWSWHVRRNDAELLKAATRLIDRGQAQEAQMLLDELLAREPTHPRALLYRGQLARDGGDLDAAARFWNRVPDHPPGEAGTARFLEATLYLEAGRARPAEAALLKSVELHPAYVQPHESLITLYSTQLRTAELRHELDAVRRFRPWTFAELYQRLNVAGKVTESVKSIARVEKFVAADSDDLDSRVALAQFYLWDDRYAEAASQLQTALSQRPGDSNLCALRAEALLGQRDLAGARQQLEQAALGPQAPLNAWRVHGLYWLACGEWNRAAALLREAVARGALDRGTVFKLGQALERTGDHAAAQSEFQRAQSLLRLHAVMFRLVQVRDAARAPVETLQEAGDLLMHLDRPADAALFYSQILARDSYSAEANQDYENALQQAQRLAESAEKGPALGQDLAREVAAGQAALADEAAAQARERTASGPPPDVPTRSAIRLVDCHVEAGFNFQFFNGDSGRKYLLETTGGGVAVLDYDGDGWPDLYFPQGCRIPFDKVDTAYSDRLYRNLGNGGFADVTNAADAHEFQFSQGAAAGDYDNDGFVDLAVANFGSNVMFHNHGDGTLGNVTSASGLAGEHYSTSLAWGDLDGDGNLDLYVANYVRDSLHVCYKDPQKKRLATCHPQAFEAEHDLLYLNLGDGTFADVTQAAGIIDEHGRGLGLIIADFDDDGRPDLFVANDGTPSFLFRNLVPAPGPAAVPAPAQRLKFAEWGLPSGTAVNAEGQATAAMGVACGDLDDDGRLDLYVTTFRGEADILYFNRGDMLFEDMTSRAGLVEATRPVLGWGTQSIDADLDGHPEIFLTNGHLDDRRDEGIPWKMPSQLFYNRGGGAYRDISRECGDFFALEALGRGVARLDWNRDGRHDLVVAFHDRPAALLKNETPLSNHRVVVQLHGVQSNRDGIGTRLRATCGGRTQVVEICGGDGYCASNEKRQIIGIGSGVKIDALEVRWPSGRRDTWADIPADSELILIEGQIPHIQGIQAR